MYDYEELSTLLPELKEYLKDGKLDYSNLKAVRLLNRALLLKEYNLKVNLPAGHLCPTVPNRTGYIKEIEIILYEILKISKTTSITGIDIGTGTSCIYPLIGCSRNDNWNFIGTDVEDEIIEYARENVEMNKEICDRIKILKNPDSTRIFPDILIKSLDTVTPKFLVCNPPFYKDSNDLETRRSFKRHKPISGQWEMSREEMGTELGGEVGFIKKMIQESSEGLRSIRNIRLFSCMLGMKESLELLIDHLKQLKIEYFAFETLQIKHTCRYLLFWSFDHEIPKDSTNHRIKITAKTKRTQIIPITTRNDFNFEEFVKDINLRYGSDPSSNESVILLTTNKWSRKYRRSSSTSPPLLPHPMRIAIQRSGNDLIFTTDEEADWETFLSFINHLRK